MVDWQRIREDYAQTSIDWPRLSSYARRVASELSSRHPHTPSWELDQRYWKREERMSAYTETMRNGISYRLERDGSLVVEVTSWSEMLNPGYWETPKETTRRPFTDIDVELFDFESRYYLSNDRSVETNRDPGSKLLVHAKGVGLSKRLGKLAASA